MSILGAKNVKSYSLNCLVPWFVRKMKLCLLTENVCDCIKISFYRVDPSIGTDRVKESPVQRAAEKDSVELLSIFAELASKPARMKIKLLKLIIESDGEQDASLDFFKQQLESLSASEVTSIVNSLIEEFLSKVNFLKL